MQDGFERRLANALVLAGFAGAAAYLVYALGWSFDLAARPVAALGAALFLAGFAVVGVVLRRHRTNAALTWFSLALSAAAGDQTLQYYQSHRLGLIRPPVFAADHDVDAAIAAGDWRLRIAVEREVEASGEPLNRAAKVFHILKAADAGLTDGILPIGGMAHRPWVHCNEGGFWPVLRTDRYGFANDDAVWEPGERTVLLVGDSYMAGECVEQADTPAGWLRKNGFRAASVAVSGNGPLAILASLREYGPVMRPRHVVWGYFDHQMLLRLINDDVAKGWGGEAYSVMLSRYLDPAFRQGLPGRQSQIDALWTRFYAEHTAVLQVAGEEAALQLRYRALQAVRQAAGLRTLAPGEQMDIDEAVDLMVRILGLARQEAESWGGTLVVAFYSGIGHFRGGRSPTRERVLLEIGRLGIPVVDIDDAMAKRGNPMAYFPFGGRPTPFQGSGINHNNALGYSVFAEEIVRGLK
jgi:hypothetical protein